MNWWTSDTHFHHTNIIKYCGRPFKDEKCLPQVWYMNHTMETRWNEAIKVRDVVYFLGDFAMGPRILIPQTLKKLNGYKILVRGNHDRSEAYMLESGFDESHEELRVNIDGIELYMRHRPAKDWKGADYHLCGHVHEHMKRRGNMINVGVDVWDFRPQKLEALLSAPEDVIKTFDPHQRSEKREADQES